MSAALLHAIERANLLFFHNTILGFQEKLDRFLQYIDRRQELLCDIPGCFFFEYMLN